MKTKKPKLFVNRSKRFVTFYMDGRALLRCPNTYHKLIDDKCLIAMVLLPYLEKAKEKASIEFNVLNNLTNFDLCLRKHRNKLIQATQDEELVRSFVGSTTQLSFEVVKKR